MNKIFLVSLLPLVGLAAQQIIYPDDPTCGVNAYTEEDDTWRSPAIHNTAAHPVTLYHVSGEDFFVHEYGVAMDFATGDPLKTVGAHVEGAYVVTNGALEVVSGKEPFRMGFGPDSRHPKDPSLRFDCAWHEPLSQRVFLEMALAQAAPSSRWEVVAYSARGRTSVLAEVVVKGTAEQIVRKGVSAVKGGNGLNGIAGIALVCHTPEACPRVKRFALHPLSGNVYYRKTFDLAFQPDRAKLSYQMATLDDYDFFVNGVNIARPTGYMMSVETMDEEIARHLRQGRNTIAVRIRYTCLYRYLCGFEPPNRLRMDLFAYDRQGQQAFVGSDATWRTTYVDPADAAWTRDAFDDSGWQRVATAGMLTRLGNGKPVAVGLNPQHMGFLTTRPVGTAYPLFSVEASEPRLFEATYPAGLKNARLTARLVPGTEDAPAEELSVSGEKVESNGFVTVHYAITGTRPGPYDLKWHLTAEGVDETCEDEVVLVGRIRQNMYPPQTFEQEFRKRLELVQTIDPKTEHVIGPRFVTSQPNSDLPAKVRVEETNGVRYLTLDAPDQSWMCWRLDTPNLGDAYHLEIDVPDTADRTTIAGVIYSSAAAYDNCPYPIGSRSMTAATGAITTGGIQPLSGGTKTLTLCFYAANRISSVILTYASESPNPAAVSAIRLYRVKGDLPGLIIPKTDRRIMEHHERFTTWQTLATTQNIVERGGFHPHVYHRHAWRYWYEAIARKIRQLRFQGHNASIEGIYMYTHSQSPSATCFSSPNRGFRFDVPRLLSWMYDANGIDCYFGWEQNRTVSSQRSGLDKGVSDRKVNAGLARGIWSVDRTGQQLTGWSYSGVNMLAPGIKEDSFQAIKEVYDRYCDTPHVKGFFLAHGYYWVPGFESMLSSNSLNVGFDDDSIERFERDTGIRLETGTTDPARFERRFQLLNGLHKESYLAWRKTIMTSWFNDLVSLLKSGRYAWPLLVSHNFSHARSDTESPFCLPDSSQEARDGYMARRLAEEGVGTDLAGRDGLTFFLPLGISPAFKWGAPKRQREWSALLENAGTQKLIGEADAVYTAYMLSELHLRLRPPDAKWYWFSIPALCSYQRPAGEAAYLRELQVCREHTPKALIIAGIDCNPYTGQAEECRRFAAGYYAVPDLPFVRTAEVKGVDARVAGTYLRLYNPSPRTLLGTLHAASPFVCDQLGLSGQNVNVVVPPYSLLVFKAERTHPDWRGVFKEE